MIKRLVRYYKPYKKLFFLDMLAAFLLSVCDLFYPVLTRKMIDDCIPNNKLKMLIFLAVSLFALYVLKYALNYFVQYEGHMVGVGIQADMRKEVFDHLEKLPLTYFDNNKTGTIMSRIINDLMDISELAHHGPEDLFISGVMLIGSFVIMATINLTLTLIVFAFVPVMVWFSASKRLKMGAAFSESRKKLGEINANLENSVSGIRVSKAYTSLDFENRQFEKGNAEFIEARRKQYKAMAEFHSGHGLISDLLMVIMYLAGGIFYFYGKIELPDFVAFLLYISAFLNPLRRLVNFTEQFQDGLAGLQRVSEILDTPEEKDSENASDIGSVRGDIEFDRVYFTYENGKKVLEDLSFRLEAGKTLALVGPSGGGKTTICHLLPRFYEIESGAIRVDGHDIREVTRSSLRRNIGIVSQDCFLFNSTIYDNIAYGCPGVTREEVIKAAEMANIDEFVESLPDGYDTIVGERGIKLSGGQKQRVAIARAFLKNPPVLILDEATSALDNATELMIQQSLEKLSAGRTTVVVAHRLTTVKNADEILVITKEGVAERGTHDTLVESGGLYSRLWHGLATDGHCS